jgi:hypothetical protein
VSELFSPDWMNAYKDAWNDEPKLTEPLSEINFSTAIGYGLLDEDKPRGVLVVENGQATFGGAYDNQEMNWDIRASAELWDNWMGSPPNLTKIGLAYTMRKLQFKQGDYSAMLKEPRMTGPFIKSFETMAQV